MRSYAVAKVKAVHPSTLGLPCTDKSYPSLILGCFGEQLGGGFATTGDKNVPVVPKPQLIETFSVLFEFFNI